MSVRLNVNGIDCFYGSAKILDHVNLTVKGGDFTGILGPNGSGKTTLLRSVSKTLKPRVGSVILNDTDVYSMKSGELARNLAVVPQHTAVTSDLTAMDIVLMGRNPHLGRFRTEGEKDIAIAREVMGLTNTVNLATRPLNELSGGEAQRVMIAQALAQEPQVLLLDEPTKHLDIISQIDVLELLKKLCKEKKISILAVFHDFNLAARYCDYVVLLHKGQVFSMGSVNEVLTKENVAIVFQVNVMVKKHPITGSLYVVPISTTKTKQNTNSTGSSIHVICGGGVGAQLMSRLIDQGYHVTTGVLDALCSDYEAAKFLGIPAVVEAPFSPISEESHQANLKSISGVKAVVICNTWFGHANLKNLEAASWALNQGITVIVVEESPIKERDFTGGEAQRRIEYLKDQGAIVVHDQDEVLSVVERIAIAAAEGSAKGRN